VILILKKLCGFLQEQETSLLAKSAPL